MSYEDRKEQRLKKRRIRNIIIMSIFILMLARSAYGIILKNPKTTLPKEEQYLISMKAESVLIRDERVYDIDGSIELNPAIEEGKRVSVGYEIGRANIVKDISSLSEELDEINGAIDLLNEKNEGSQVFKGDKESLESAQESLIKEIQQKINERDYSGISDLRNQIIFNDEKLGNVSMDHTLLSQSLESLNSRRDTILNEINNNSTVYYTQESGVISFEIDDYEKLYVPKEFENYTFNQLQIPETNKSKKTADKEDKVLNKYKIIKNFDWYLAIKVDDIKNLASYEINNALYLKIADNDRELVGNIVAINHSDGKAVYIVKFNSYLDDYYNVRFPDVEIILKRQDTFFIPTKAIIDNDGVKGVYIKEFNGIVRFRPIEILGEEDDHTFISKGDANRYINVESENPVRTISLYDEILINPWNFKEGDILN